MAGDLSGTGVTANVLVPGGPANTAAVPLEAGFDRAQLIHPEAMVPPTLWLCSKDADMVTGQRFLAVKWDPNLPSEQAAANSSRSEEHTSELQSLMRISYAVFCLKNKNT